MERINTKYSIFKSPTLRIKTKPFQLTLEGLFFVPKVIS